MITIAVSKITGLIVNAKNLSSQQWTDLKLSHGSADFELPCGCDASLKTSSRGENFFVHKNTKKCPNSAGMIWHTNTKKLIRGVLEEEGIYGYENYKVSINNSKSWIADIYFEVKGQQFVIEVQHTYRPLSQYLNRQKNLEDSGIKSYWVLPIDLYSSLVSATTKLNQRSTFNVKSEENESPYRCLECLPVIYVKSDFDPQVGGEGGLKCDMRTWIRAILNRKFIYQDGVWDVL